jgi:hypothetical protein
MSSIKIEHYDKLGRLISVGDCVVYPTSNSLEVGTVKKLNPKMVKVSKIPASKWSSRGVNKYPQDIVKVDGPEVVMYILKNSG